MPLSLQDVRGIVRKAEELGLTDARLQEILGLSESDLLQLRGGE